MIAGLFLNPGFLFIAAALISVPIIIHLINRMRFKRIRWAAMEFLLKAQKRTRKRLIIEQLILLALRCLLLALVGLLVSRFVGCGENNSGGTPNIHIALLDDTLSMQDAVKQADGTMKSCYDVAKNDFLLKKIAKGLASSKTNDILVIIPLSKLNDPSFDVKTHTYERLNELEQMKKLTQEVNELQPSMLHVDMLQGVKEVQKIITQYPESRVRLHILSDFRHEDWKQPQGAALTNELVAMVKKHDEFKIYPIDCVLPSRATNQGGFPPARDNVGIVDVRPSTRIAGHKMPVRFAVSIANFSGKQIEAYVVVRNEITGKDMRDVDIYPQNPIKLTPGGETQVFFDYGDVRRGLFFDNIKTGESLFAHLSVRLTNPQLLPLENDGIHPDNIRHTVVEVHDKVPILIIDGEVSSEFEKNNRKGRNEGGDSFFLGRALISVPGASYDLVFGDELVKAGSVKALELPNLSKYPTIFLVNVPSLSPKQLANLENFVKDGGGLGIFMGPKVDSAGSAGLNFYNGSFYKDGAGLFPAPLKQLYPLANEKELPPKESDTYQLITREDKMPPGMSMLPIFGTIFEEPKQREPLRNLPIRRYFKVNRNAWKQEPGRVFELATLPNEDAGTAYENAVAQISQPEKGEALRGILNDGKLAKYHGRLRKLLADVENKVKPGSEFKAYHLANEIDALLNDKGNQDPNGPAPDMTELWSNADANVQSMRRQLITLRELVRYGDPFVIAQNFGKGKVVAVMSTAGKEWNDWPGGSAASVLYAPFIWEVQNYLSSPGGDANLTVGTNIPLVLDAAPFNGMNLKLVRYFAKTENEREVVKEKVGEEVGRVEESEIHFNMTGHLKPGLYLSDLIDGNVPEKALIASFAHAFNVDTLREGKLQRISDDELRSNLIDQGGGRIKMVGPTTTDAELVPKSNDVSESPWLFLILLLVLVAEQALAVHLSFHLRNTDTEMSPAGAGS
ncbi:MAG: hypothetical protein EXR98_02690 [Gemmataceae bacterium]|nr:hypothetical protein [Gemmataceae bacterium]